MDTAVLTFEGSCLVPASNYTFNLTVFAEGRRNGTSFQMIELYKDPVDILELVLSTTIIHCYLTLSTSF